MKLFVFLLMFSIAVASYGRYAPKDHHHHLRRFRKAVEACTDHRICQERYFEDLKAGLTMPVAETEATTPVTETGKGFLSQCGTEDLEDKLICLQEELEGLTWEDATKLCLFDEAADSLSKEFLCWNTCVQALKRPGVSFYMPRILDVLLLYCSDAYINEFQDTAEDILRSRFK